jgi:lipopolysaccharide/colanic/teichoic acid biosynthesis glycosyltransferase
MTRLVLFIIDVILINASPILVFLVRYRLDVPEYSFAPFKKSFVFLTVIYISALSFFRVYKSRFRSSWDLFKRIFLGLFLGTLLSVAFVYVFRIKWGAFPTSIFVISFFVNLLLIFKVNQFVLKAKNKIKKQVIILGEGKVDDIVGKKANVERKRIYQIRELLEYSNVDEIVVSEKITNAKDLNLLLYLERKLKADILFSPLVYMELLPERINGNSSVELLSTFVGRQSDLDEFFIRILDISTSLISLILAGVPMLIISILIKLTSRGTVIYKQERVGKDGKTFTLYKFRTMVKDAEKMAGFSPATENDPRIKKIGKWLRMTRLDELPQLLNVLKGQMSLVGPRPENLCRVENHEALQSLRLVVKPGLTGLAQIRSFYDLNPRHKIKYDYLYIQRRSLALNIYILLQTIPVVFSRKGW